MPDRIFVDTNILVYAHDVSAGLKNTTAKQLVQELWVNKLGCLSIQVMQEFYVTVTQKVPNPMDNATAIEVIRSLRYWNVHEPSIDDIINAIDIQIRYQVSFWDAMILQSALQLECDLLWSEDLNPGQVYQGIKLINPLQ
jgi:predicted nucleic acid-binding protein